MDEFSALSSTHSNKLKNIITAHKTRYERKGKDAVTVDNLSNFLFTSNDEDTLQVSADDRRLVLFKCSRMYKGNSAYFRTLSLHLRRPEVARGFYQHLMTRDLSDYPDHFQANRPITQYYLDMQRVNIPSFSGYLSAMINNDTFPRSITAGDFFKHYREFHMMNGYKGAGIATATAFGNAMGELPGGAVQKRKTKTTRQYEEFNADIIQAYLVSKNEYDKHI